ncbi:MAG: hypothetical protein R3B39_01805 [Candidatus Paceibacterota bacterium]
MQWFLRLGQQASFGISKDTEKKTFVFTEVFRQKFNKEEIEKFKKKTMASMKSSTEEL